MGKLSGKTALVTGGARGIGRSYALRLADLGANVGIIDLDLKSFKQFKADDANMTAESIIEELKNIGVMASGAEADVTDFEQVEAAVSKISSDIGNLDILVTNAGGGLGSMREGLASSMNLDIFQKVMERNFYGTVHTVKLLRVEVRYSLYKRLPNLGILLNN